MRHDVARSTYVKGPSSKSWQVCVFRTGTMGIVLVFRISYFDIYLVRQGFSVDFLCIAVAGGGYHETNAEEK